MVTGSNHCAESKGTRKLSRHFPGASSSLQLGLPWCNMVLHTYIQELTSGAVSQSHCFKQCPAHGRHLTDTEWMDSRHLQKSNNLT